MISIQSRESTEVVYFILDRAVDFKLLNSTSWPTSFVIPISADARTGIPRSFPREQVINLSQLISAETLAETVVYRVSSLIAAAFELPDCNYYKIKQLFDSTIEKQVIVEALAGLPGEKYFVGGTCQWFSADGDNSENLRIAAEYMSALPGFHAIKSDRQPILTEALKRISRTIRATWRAAILKSTIKTWDQHTILIGNDGYGASIDFLRIKPKKIDIGTLILSSLLRFQWTNAIRLVLHDLPVMSERPSSHHQHLGVAISRKLLHRSASLQRIIDSLFSRIGSPKYFFTVNYGRMIDISIVRGMQSHGVPIITMQHACVGHDNWTASQYLDLWESDIKIVANAFVAEQLSEFETRRRPQSKYLTAYIPMYRKKSEKVRWDGRSITYILTGFTRANTMYDNRRINDSLYLEQISSDIRILSENFKVRIRSHPYDDRQYQNAIAEWLAAESQCELISRNTNSFGNESLVIVDSPSTIMADVIRSGAPLFLINRTAKLREDFMELAAKYEISFPSAIEIVQYLKSRTIDSITRSQADFSDRFYSDYCYNQDTRPLPAVLEDAIPGNLGSHQCMGLT